MDQGVSAATFAAGLSGDARRNWRQKLARRKAWCLVAITWGSLRSHIFAPLKSAARRSGARPKFPQGTGAALAAPALCTYSAAWE